ncbi:MAG TPA: hypothetical protein VG873_04350 [Burkholderiales bacterium]|nr:hypothetical protein [Burkholderiales bacterium]
MTFSREELRKLALPLVVAAILLGAGAALVWQANGSLAGAKRALAAAQAERTQTQQKLARIAEEEREVKEKMQVYEHLKRLNILGEERRLEWADAIARIRAQRELLDLRYRVDRQRVLASLPGNPGSVDFRASTMRVELALLHEEDLLRFLSDLRQSGNAYYSVRRCSIGRTGQPAGSATVSPRLRAECEIDLITVLDRGAKS